jgi:hypothetical protein
MTYTAVLVYATLRQVTVRRHTQQLKLKQSLPDYLKVVGNDDYLQPVVDKVYLQPVDDGSFLQPVCGLDNFQAETGIQSSS